MPTLSHQLKDFDLGRYLHLGRKLMEAKAERKRLAYISANKSPFTGFESKKAVLDAHDQHIALISEKLTVMMLGAKMGEPVTFSDNGKSTTLILSDATVDFHHRGKGSAASHFKVHGRVRSNNGILSRRIAVITMPIDYDKTPAMINAA